MISAKLRKSIDQNGWIGTLALVPKNIKFLLTDFDIRHGTDTRCDIGAQGMELPSHHEGYEGVPHRLFHKIIAQLDVDLRGYTFVDLGSGKGKALMLAAHHPFQRILGIEYDLHLHEASLNNLRRYRPSANRLDAIECRHGDAREVEYPAGNLLVYLFNPFGSPILAEVLAKLTELPQNENGEILVIYQNPLHRNLFDNSPYFEVIHDSHYRMGLWSKPPIGRVVIFHKKACTSA
ncbi:class I SAM-dependent methyltransferase [Ectothiorhodospira sp. BSL-9]|uniref:class I SAM-dependent methyltransferase n=1 Tax=Ectothiorhodospira sp. BSL-9 TaxID=1442136 RepID=UPI0009EF498A|nr:class I SAM-dependent methyltransferase [Ectothiorhodospira sp. BSL-9]